MDKKATDDDAEFDGGGKRICNWVSGSKLHGNLVRSSNIEKGFKFTPICKDTTTFKKSKENAMQMRKGGFGKQLRAQWPSNSLAS